MNDALQIYPEIDFLPDCPVDGTPLHIESTAIPGMRSLVEGVCPSCDSPYYVDLPVSHALWNRVTLNPKTQELYNSREPNWITKALLKGFLNQDQREIIPVVHKFRDAERIVILNCLDYVYGHALLKLLNAQRHIDNSPEVGCCVLVSPELSDLVPDGVAEIWEFPVLVGEYWKWYPSLQRWVNAQLRERKECFLSFAYSHPSNNVFDLRRHVRNLPDVSAELKGHSPVIMFCHREDRLWGRTLAEQQHNLQTLLDQLSDVFPELAFILLGFGRETKLHAQRAKLIDVRVDRFEKQMARQWLAYMQNTDCCIGVMGSNMLLPSGLAKSTVDLVQRTRSLNFFQDVLFTNCNEDVRLAFLKYRFVFGNARLSDVKVAQVIDAVASIFAHSERSTFWFRIGEEDSVEFRKAAPNVQAQALAYLRAERAKEHNLGNYRAGEFLDPANGLL